MKLFLRYAAYHKKAVLFYAVLIAVAVGMLTLFELPVTPVVYTAAVGVFIAVLVLIPDFLRFWKKHAGLVRLCGEIDLGIEHLPAGDNLIEADYAALVRRLFDEKLQIANTLDARYQDLIEYYTVWVHQIKTPIAAMRLNLGSGDAACTQELADDLRRIEQYVEMVLCYLRLDSGASDLVIRQYDLDPILCQAVRKYAGPFIRRKIKLNYEPLCCTVLTDEKWLLFVIEQVLSNALKYTRAGSISITLEAPKTLCIRDTGIGIAPEDLPRIFEKGYTGYNGRSDKKASGIGLYLCRRICTKLGHTITAESSPGAGTAIRIGLQSATLETE